MISPERKNIKTLYYGKCGHDVVKNYTDEHGNDMISIGSEYQEYTLLKSHFERMIMHLARRLIDSGTM